MNSRIVVTFLPPVQLPSISKCAGLAEKSIVYVPVAVLLPDVMDICPFSLNVIVFVVLPALPVHVPRILLFDVGEAVRWAVG